MELIELFYPEIQAQAGSYLFDRAVEVEVYSDEASYFDWAKIRFTPEFQPKLIIGEMEEGRVRLGYSGVLEDVFEGYVAKPYNSGGYVNEITLKDEMMKLENTFINNTFLDTTPQEMLAYCLGQAKVGSFKLADQVYPAKATVPIYRKNVIAVIKELHAIWGISQKFFFSGGVFHWGTLPEQSKLYHFEYGVNIIALERPLGVWELETVSMPFVKHSHRIKVTHPKVSGEFLVKKVVFSTNDTGFIRTVISF